MIDKVSACGAEGKGEGDGCEEEDVGEMGSEEGDFDGLFKKLTEIPLEGDFPVLGVRKDSFDTWGKRNSI